MKGNGNYTIDQINKLLNDLKESINLIKTTFGNDFKKLYDVGRIVESTSPLDLTDFPVAGAKWELMEEGIFLESTKDSSKVGTNIDAGLPNITGKVVFKGAYGDIATIQSSENAFSNSGEYAGGSEQLDKASGNYLQDLYFNASNSSPIYGKSNTVQPHSKLVYRYIRIS